MPSFPELTGALADAIAGLRAYEERDIPEILIAYQDDPHLHQRMGEEREPTGAQLGREWEDGPLERAEGRGVILTIVAAGSDVFAGRLSVGEVDWDNRHAGVRLWVAAGRRGQGMGRSALRLAADWLTGPAGLGRVGLRVPADNEPLLRAAAAAGFEREGLLRSYERGPHGRYDVVPMSRVAANLG
jgi:RimJ/RimL family protein N-acetyltransferase